ncbi:MAG: hypothetical protein RIR41_2793 [Pseudomonadota bacterium]
MRIVMKRTAAIGLAAASMAAMWQPALSEPPAPGGPPATVENFTLSDQSGTPHELHSLIDAPAIVIATQVNGDPLSREAVQSLEGIKAVFRKAEYFLLNSSSVDTRATIAAEANALGSTIPILDDEAQTVVRDLGFTQTGEAIIIDPAGWKIVYRGPVSALAAQDPDARYLLFNAVVHAVGHRPIEEPKVAVKGAKLDGAGRN